MHTARRLQYTQVHATLMHYCAAGLMRTVDSCRYCNDVSSIGVAAGACHHVHLTAKKPHVSACYRRWDECHRRCVHTVQLVLIMRSYFTRSVEWWRRSVCQVQMTSVLIISIHDCRCATLRSLRRVDIKRCHGSDTSLWPETTKSVLDRLTTTFVIHHHRCQTE